MSLSIVKEADKAYTRELEEVLEDLVDVVTALRRGPAHGSPGPLYSIVAEGGVKGAIRAAAREVTGITVGWHTGRLFTKAQEAKRAEDSTVNDGKKNVATGCQAAVVEVFAHRDSDRPRMENLLQACLEYVQVLAKEQGWALPGALQWKICDPYDHNRQPGVYACVAGLPVYEYDFAPMTDIRQALRARLEARQLPKPCTGA